MEEHGIKRAIETGSSGKAKMFMINKKIFIMFFATFYADIESGVEHYADNDAWQSETAPGKI